MERFDVLKTGWEYLRSEHSVVPAQIPVHLTMAYTVHKDGLEYPSPFASHKYPLRKFLEPGRISRYARSVLEYYEYPSDMDWVIEDHSGHSHIFVREMTKETNILSYVITYLDIEHGNLHACSITEPPPGWFLRLCNKYTFEHLPLRIPRLDDLVGYRIHSEVVEKIGSMDGMGLRISFIPAFIGDNETKDFIRPGQIGYTSLRNLLEKTEWDEFNVAVSSLAYGGDDEWFTEAGVIISRYQIGRDDKIRLLSGIEVRDYFDINEVGEYTNI